MSLSFQNKVPTECGSYGSFRYEVINPESSSATVKIYIPAEDSVKAVPGCMMATSSNIQIQGKLKKTLKALLGPDESRHQIFTAKESDGWVILTPAFFGSIRVVEMNNEEICVGDDAFLASCGAIESTAVRQGMKKAFMSGHGLFVKKVKGTGVIFLCAVGSMMTMELADGEDIIVDNGHLVSWPRDIKYEVQKASKSWFGSGLSGEGVVCKVSGPGLIHVQTRNAEEIAEWVYDSKTPPGGSA